VRFCAYIFEGCDSLLVICIPARVRELTAMSLARSRIESVTVDPENRSFKVWSCFLVDFAGTCLVRYFGKEGEVAIGRDILGIARGCFSYCDSIGSVRFEPGCQITTLSESAFEQCSSLESICIPASVLTIATDCFRNCRRLSTVTFEAGSHVPKIGHSVFAECPSLHSIRLPASVAVISPSCFDKADLRGTVVFEAGAKLSEKSLMFVPWRSNVIFE
jgi:hypothetical protein